MASVSNGQVTLSSGQVISNPQEGAWYDGQQYVNGTLSTAGSINSQSNQQGAGQPVSTAVASQTNPANPGYIASQGGSTVPSTPTAQDAISSYQGAASDALSAVDADANQSDEEIMSQVTQALTGNLPAQPTPPNLAATYQGYLSSMGVNDMNTQLAGLNKQIVNIQTALESEQASEESQAGPGGLTLGVISGRETEEQRQANIQLDSLNLQAGVLNQQIQTQMTNISTIMSLTQQDYTNASQAWQNEFSVNSAIYNAFTTQVQNRDQLAVEVQKAAATNLQTMANLISSGNLNFSALPASAQTQITSMEVQAGLPVGTLASIQMSPGDRLLNVSQYRGQVTAILANPDGQITTQTFGDAAPLTSSTSSTTKAQVSAANSQAESDAERGMSLDDLTSIYGSILTPAQINTIYTDYGSR